MAELADAADSKSAEGNLVGVRPPLPAPKSHILLYVALPLGIVGLGLHLTGTPHYGMRHVVPPKRGALVRRLPTATATEPLKSHFLDDGEPPPVWLYPEGTVRGLSFSPFYKGGSRIL
jgi:hypothetical protein